MKLRKLQKTLSLLLIGLLVLSACSKGEVDKDIKDIPIIDEKEENNKETEEIPTEKEEAVSPKEVVIIQDNNYTVSAGISKTNPQRNIEAIDSLEIRNTSEEKTDVLIRIPLPAGISHNDLVSASLQLKKKDGDEPALQAKGITKVWDRLDVNWDDLNGNYLDSPSPLSQKVDGDWYSIDVTEIIKNQLRGESGQYGIMIEETKENTETSFFSSYDTVEDCPQLVIQYIKSDEILNQYEYAEQESGNCLSFSIRDTSPILMDDLQIDFNALGNIYSESGLDAAADYVEALAMDYIHEHMEALQIKQIRKLSSWDEPIDREKEYKIVTRIGVEENYDGTLSFDYHWQVQLPDGSWAEKLGATISHIIPGTNRDLDPSLYPWDQNEIWGINKWTAFYDSKASFFAVEKETTDFTNHRP